MRARPVTKVPGLPLGALGGVADGHVRTRARPPRLRPGDSFHAFVGACPEPHIEDPGSRFRDMAQLSGGVAVDACGPWSAAVDSLEQSVTAFNRRFILRGTPDVSAPIVVRVDGSPLAPTQWAYDQQQGAVTLALPPPAGATIDVTYIPSCG